MDDETNITTVKSGCKVESITKNTNKQTKQEAVKSYDHAIAENLAHRDGHGRLMAELVKASSERKKSESGVQIKVQMYFHVY